jgi:hypothetical protein
MELIKHELRGEKPIAIYYDGPEVTKEEAREKKLTRYFERESICLHGHISQRGTANGGCVACSYGKPPALDTYTAPPETAEGQPDQEGASPPEEKENPTSAAIDSTGPDFIGKLTPANIARSVIAGCGAEGIIISRVNQICTEKLDREIHLTTTGSLIRAMAKKGHLQQAGMRSNAIIYKPTPSFFVAHEHMKDFFEAISPDLAVSIDNNFARAEERAEETLQELEQHNAEQTAIDHVRQQVEFVDHPRALIGKAIVDYISVLRKQSDYGKVKAQLDEIVASLQRYKTRCYNLDKSLKELTAKHNATMREKADLKHKLDQSENAREILAGLLQDKSRSTFNKEQLAAIDGFLDDNRFKVPETGGLSVIDGRRRS